jgi:uncharacterized protein (TIGR02147 family)
MDSSVFDFTDFKQYLSLRFATMGKSRGMRIKFAQLIHASPSYVSKVLSSSIKLNLEYVPVINKLLQHNDQEAEYFMLIVLYSQSGSKDLELYFRGKIDAFLEKRRVDAEWVLDPQELTETVQARYSSQWFYIVIHVMLCISTLQTKSAIAERLKLSLSTVASALEYLVKAKLVRVNGDRYSMTKNRVHLKKDSNWILQYHKSLRQYVVHRLSESLPGDIHYSLVAAISLEDVEMIKKKLRKLLSEFEPMMDIEKKDTSKKYDVHVFSLDFFNV